MSVYAEGGCKGVIWLLEGPFGRGWHHFVGELCLMLATPEAKSGFVESESLSEVAV